MRVRFMLFSIERANKISRRFIWVGEKLSSIFYKTQYDLRKARIDIPAERYFTAALFSALVYGVLFFFLFAGLLFLKDGGFTAQAATAGGVAAIAGFTGFFMLHIMYPGIMASNVASGIDDSLLFALKNILIQVKSGVSLYEAMVNVSRANYGQASIEFGQTVQEINAGESQIKALEKLALKTNSEYMKKTSWQLLTSIQSGSSVAGALESVVGTLQSHQFRAIKNYGAELNMIILIYLMLAAAVPTLGITFLVILSSMGGASVGPEAIYAIIGFAVVMQIIIFGFIRARMPKVYA